MGAGTCYGGAWTCCRGVTALLPGPWSHRWVPALPTGARPAEIIERVKSGERPSFRPSASVGCQLEELGQLMQHCWAEDVLERPDFNQIRVQLRKFNRCPRLLSPCPPPVPRVVPGWFFPPPQPHGC